MNGLAELQLRVDQAAAAAAHARDGYADGETSAARELDGISHLLVEVSMLLDRTPRQDEP